QLNPTPFCRICVSHRFDDFDDFCSGSDSLLFQFEKTVMRRCACFIGVLKDAVLSASDTAAADMAIPTATAIFGGWTSRCRHTVSTRLAKPAKYLGYYITNQSLVNCAHSNLELLFRAINLFTHHIDRIDDPDDHRVHRRIFQIRGEPRRAALAKHH